MSYKMPTAYKAIKKINSRLNNLFAKKALFDTMFQTALMQNIYSAAF